MLIKIVNCNMNFKAKRNLINYLFYLFLYGGILVDNIVGYYMRTTLQENNIGKVYRIFHMIFLLYILIIYNTLETRFVLCSFSLSLILPFFYYFLYGNKEVFITDYIYIVKLYFPICLCLAGKILCTRNYITKAGVENYIFNVSWIYPLTIIVPYCFNLGFKAYHTSGYSGFYSSGNELSIVLCVCFTIAFKQFCEKKMFKYVIHLALTGICVILTGAKTGILIILMTVLWYAFKEGKKNIKFYISVMFILGVLSIFIIFLFSDEILMNISRLQYKYKLLNNNLINFLFSNRNQKILPNLKKTIYDFPKGMLNIFIGKGYYNQVIMQKVSKNIASFGLIEMDFFDVFFEYGIFETIFVCTFYIKVLLTKIRKQKEIYKFIYIYILMFSAFAGHTLFQSQSGMILGIIACINLIYKKGK